MIVPALKLSVLATALFTMSPLSTVARAQDLGLALGSRPSAVTVHTLDGKPIDLSAYIGKTPVLIEFWATWCGNCRELMPTLAAAEKKFGKRVKFVVLAVAINQSPERVRRYMAAHPMAHDMLFDTDGKAAAEFDAPATSYVVILDKTGRVVYTGLGGKQNLEAALAKAL
ncbi:MAG: TlpA disulfide reductase family protein [Gemmatimonadaceae bacterium]